MPGSALIRCQSHSANSKEKSTGMQWEKIGPGGGGIWNGPARGDTNAREDIVSTVMDRNNDRE
jgi:hypothetical protein